MPSDRRAALSAFPSATGSSSQADALFRRAYQRVCGWEAREKDDGFTPGHDTVYNDIVDKIGAKEKELKEKHDILAQEQEEALQACRNSYEHMVVYEGLLAFVEQLNQHHKSKMDLDDVASLMKSYVTQYEHKYEEGMKKVDKIAHDAAAAGHSASGTHSAPTTSPPSPAGSGHSSATAHSGAATVVAHDSSAAAKQGSDRRRRLAEEGLAEVTSKGGVYISGTRHRSKQPLVWGA
jgi:hypothetical protein